MRSVDVLRSSRAAEKDLEVLEVIRRHPGGSTEDYAVQLGKSWHSVRPRIRKLHEAGLIVRCGGVPGRDPMRYRAVDNESLLQEALQQIAALQPAALAMIESSGFVFQDLVEPTDELDELGQWRKLALSLYSEICRSSTIAREVLEECGAL